MLSFLLFDNNNHRKICECITDKCISNFEIKSTHLDALKAKNHIYSLLRFHLILYHDFITEFL
jgi:hypothetical protein